MALLPAISHALALARGQSTQWTEVCTPQGMRLVALPDSAPGSDGAVPLQAAAHLEHCPMCHTAQDTPLLPATPAGAVAWRAEGRTVPLLYLHAPYTLHAWRSAQPRGPPILS